MAALISIDDLRQMFSISADIVDGRLSGPCAAASSRLREWVGDVTYTDALSSSPVDVDRKAHLRTAEGILAMHFALPGLNTQLRSNGVVVSERVEGGARVTYLAPEEIRQIADVYLNQAEEIVRPYMLSDSTIAAALAVITNNTF